MMRRCFDLEVKRRHVVAEPCMHEVVRVGAVPGCAVEEAPDGLQRLKESRHAEVVE